MILVDITPARYGGLIVTPCSPKVREAFHTYMRRWDRSGDSAYVQEGEERQFIDDYVPRSQLRWLRRGWDITIRLDPFIYGNLLGYDACRVDPSDPKTWKD